MATIGKDKIIVLDTETTGLLDNSGAPASFRNEILQLAIVGGNGSLLFNEYFKPVNKTQWPSAQRVNGISSRFVQNKPCFDFFKDRIQGIVNDAELIVAYNVKFDLTFLRNAGISFAGKKSYDVMKEFAKKHGPRKQGRYSTYGRYVSLTKCAEYYGYDMTKVHDAVADSQATLYCFLRMQEEFLAEGGNCGE